MKCQVFIPVRHYSKPGNCSRRDVTIVRWAPTPRTTTVYRLCGIHKRVLEENGKIDLGARKEK